jgi:hypothetical protein
VASAPQNKWRDGVVENWSDAKEQSAVLFHHSSTPTPQFKMVLAAVLAHDHHCTCTGDALDVVSLLLDYASNENGVMEYWSVGLLMQKLMEPPAGAAPAELLYKRSSQAAARRRKRFQ